MEEKKTPAGRAGKWALWATAVPAAFGIVPYMILRAPGQSEGLIVITVVFSLLFWGLVVGLPVFVGGYFWAKSRKQRRVVSSE
jgi:hypothetical protein